MISWVVGKGSEAPVLDLEMAMPEPGPGEVLIKVAASGLNFADLLMLSGQYQDTPPRPYVPGLECSGHIVGFGPGLGGETCSLQMGQAVMAYSGQGGLSHYTCVPANRVLPVPASMTLEQAAGFPIAYGTSHMALHHRAALQEGETLCVTGASSGVGLTAVELGHRMGARVIAVARGPQKAAVARSAGADHVLDSEAPDLRGDLKALGGVDVVYDTVGGALSDPCLRALRPEGRYLAIGFASGEVPKFAANLLLVKNISVMGLYWGGYLTFRPDILFGGLADLARMHQQSPLALTLGHVLPHTALPEGLALLKTRKATGKVVITWPQ